MEICQRSHLPDSEWSNERCFLAEYYGHGDIFMATWEGPLDFKARPWDGVSKCFNLAHGCEAVIIAGLAGYLKRAGKSDQDIATTMIEAAQEILNDDETDISWHNMVNRGRLKYVAAGEPFPGFDRPEEGLSCLFLPIPGQPGLIEETGGTGFYTKREAGTTKLVIAAHLPDRQEEKGTRINHTAEFTATDVPAIAGMICKLALGYYRRDIKKFVTDQFVNAGTES